MEIVLFGKNEIIIIIILFVFSCLSHYTVFSTADFSIGFTRRRPRSLAALLTDTFIFT